MNGALGLREYGFSSTFVTRNAAPSSRDGETARVVLVELRRVALSAPSGPKSRPVATRFPSSPTSRAWNFRVEASRRGPTTARRGTPSARARAGR